MKIIVDAMGGDFAPLAPVKGALMAHEQYGVDIVLTGKSEEILKAAQQCGCKELPAGVEIVNTTEVVEICDDPATAFKRKKDSSLTVGLTMLHGGKYGTSLKLNFSHVHSIEQNKKKGGGPGTDGYGSAFWKWGDKTYYQDLNVQIEKKLSKSFKLNLMYMNQFYNKTVVEGHGGLIHSDIYIAEGKYRINNKLTLRGEAQYLHTEQDQGDWYFGLLELSFLPHFMFTISDQYNGAEYYYTPTGAIDEAKGTHKEHYLNGSVTFTAGAHRLQVGYGKTRAGYNCSGGVCRFVPASKGVTVSYNYNF